MKGRILETSQIFYCGRSVTSFDLLSAPIFLEAAEGPVSWRARLPGSVWPFGSVRPCLVGSVWLCQALPGFVWPFRALSGTAILCSLPELFPDHTQLPVAVFCLFWHKGHVPFMFLTIFQLPPWILLPSCRPQSTLFLRADFQRELLWPFSNCVIMCTGESW